MTTERPAPSRPGIVQPAPGDGEGGEAEIGLGLAAAGREEQEIDDRPVGMGRIGESVEIEQDEGELEQAPGRRLLICRRLSIRWSRRAGDWIGPSRGS